MIRYKIGIIGLGHASSWHLNALLTLNSLFDVVGAYDIHDEAYKILPENIKPYESINDLLLEELDCLVVLTPSQTRPEIMKLALDRKIHLFVEKPIATNLKILNELITIANENKIVIHGAMHAKFTSTVLNLIPQLEINNSETRHSKLGKLLHLVLTRHDPYLIPPDTINAPEDSSGWDSLPNIFSELRCYAKSYDVKSHQYSSFSEKYKEIKILVTGHIPGGTFEANCDWTTGKNKKVTRLYFESGIIELDHTNQVVKILSNRKDLLSEVNFSGIGDRLNMEYYRAYIELYEVLNKVIPSNINLIYKDIQNIENLYRN